MKTAFAYWENRISPVFDTTRQVLVVESEGPEIIGSALETLPETPPVQKALRLVELQVGTLVCGAISTPVCRMVTAYGIEVIPFVAGALADVVQACLTGHLDHGRYAMPGCRDRKRRRTRFGY